MNEFAFNSFFAQMLIEKGYSPDSILVEYRVPKSDSLLFVDLAIIDNVTNELLAVFEIKILKQGVAVGSVKERGKKQLNNALTVLGNPKLPAFLVIAQSEDNYSIYPYETNEENQRDLSSEIDIEALPLYTHGKLNSIRLTAVDENQAKTRKNRNAFFAACWIGALAVCAVTILDIVGCITISATQLALIGVTIALLLIPFASKLKILGIEFERLSAEKK